MEKRLLFSCLVILLIILPLISSCQGEIATTTSSTKSSTSSAANTKTAVSVTSTATTGTTTQESSWWDMYGEPKYGGDIVFASARYSENFDPYNTGYSAHYYYLETLVIPDWTLDREIWPFKTPFIPAEYYQGNLIESWETPDLQTMIVHVRPGIHFQDKEPVNGRELTAYDLEYHYARFLGNGYGFTVPSAQDIARIGVIESCTAQDDYTAVFKFKSSSVLNAELILAQDGYNSIEAREVIEKYGSAVDWRNAVGTGPWIVSNVTSGSSMEFVKNPNYWGYDERHPENKIPYADTLTVLNISDIATRIAALRTGKVHFVDELNWQQAVSLAKSNPELEQAKLFFISSNGLQIQADKPPFDDIRVRKAMQMAIDRPAIAAGYYGGTSDGKPCGAVNPINVGWCIPYDEWPSDLQEEYSYHPDKSKELLSEAGYPEGFSFTLLADNQADQAVIEIMKSYLADVGIEMQIDIRDAPTAQALMFAFNYEGLWTRNTGSVAQPSTVCRMDYSTASQNTCRVNDSEYDALTDKLVASTDMDEVKELTRQLDMMTISNHWGIRIFPISIYSVWYPDLKGYSGENMLRMGSPGGWPWARFWLDSE